MGTNKRHKMIKYNCRHFRGAKPCLFNKTDGYECPSCPHFHGYRDRILFVKLDAIGDVLRSASLLPAIIRRHSSPYVAWLTRNESAELVTMMKYVDETITLSEEGLARIITGNWDQVYSLSNDLASASLATLSGGTKSTPVGFYVDGGIITPSNTAAEEWIEMGAFDRLKKANQLSYQELMLRIIGCPDEQIEVPALEVSMSLKQAAQDRLTALFGDHGRRRIAINIGAGARWPKKMLSAEQISYYITQLRERVDLDVVLVGGAAEAKKASTILSMCSSDQAVHAALTETSVAEFVALLSQMDVLLCGDTLALHIATAIGLPTVAVFGPTSSAEIFDFKGLVHKTWTSKLDCLVCYADCSKKDNCMSLIDIGGLIDNTIVQLNRNTPLYS